MTSAHIDTYVRDNLPPLHQQPEFIFNLPDLQTSEQLNASSILDNAITQGFADNPAVLWTGGGWTYAQLVENVNRIAGILQKDLRLIPGNRVLLYAPNTALTIAAWWAILRAGGIAVAVMPMLRASELQPILNKANVSHALVHTTVESEFSSAVGNRNITTLTFGGGELEKRLARASRQFETVPTASDDPALVAFTSGTTGEPKGCIHYHRDILAMANTFSRHIVQPKSSDVFCGTAPYAFTFGLGASIVFPAMCGASTAIPEAPGYDALATTLAQHNVTTLFTAPTGYRALTKIVDARFKSLTSCISAGEHLPRTTAENWRTATGLDVIDGIGATEMIHIFISTQKRDIRLGATGKAVPGYTACVMDESLKPLPPGQIGRLAVKGPTGCRYLSDSRQTKYVADGWNITGDLYRTDEDGYFWYVSRADDMIVSSGYNIAAPEVENALLLHETVAETAVIGIPDDERGQISKAYIVLKDHAAPSDTLKRALQEHVKRTIAPYKYPRAIEFVSSLPKTHTGKLMRHRLK